jgi:hypothetical protein
MGTISNFKYGICPCGKCPTNIEVPGRKVGKTFMCLSTYNTMKAQEQLEKKKDKDKIRSLVVSNTGSAYRPVYDKLVNNTAARNFNIIIGLKEWFEDRRFELTGICQCGCGNPSSKNDDRYFRHSCCHILPKSKFYSVALHPLNCIERAFWGGCHSVLDDTSIKRWVQMADWENIKHRFLQLELLLTEEEKTIKFYTELKDLVYGT